MANYLKTTTSFSTLCEEDMPREKALRYGIKSLTDAELMAVLFSTGTAGMSVLEMSERILQDNDGHLYKVTNMSADDLTKRYKGVGRAKALLLLAALELGERSARDAASIKDLKILSSNTAYDLMRPEVANIDHEEFWVILLSNAATVIGKERVASGGQTSTLVDIRILMRRAIEAKAVRMILVHNHPSGQLKPSPQDDALTRKIKTAAETLDLRVDDHLIISPKGYYSYNDEFRL